MVASKDDVDLEKTGTKAVTPGRTPQAKFGVFGEEMIEKQVKPSGNVGRIYLPLDWVGKHVKIIRID